MTQAEIKSEANQLNDQIKVAKDRLSLLMKICTHENTIPGMFSLGKSSVDGKLCTDCGKAMTNVESQKNINPA